MRTNLEDIAKSRSFKFEEETEYFVEIKDVIALLQFVRQKTLEEAANKARIINDYSGNTGSEYCDTILDRKSILQLDKDSIEI